MIECKVVRPGRGLEGVVTEGIPQSATYVDATGAQVGPSGLFDLRTGRTWSEPMFRREEAGGGRAITVSGT